MSEQKHYVTLTIEGGELHRGFVCESAPDAVCRRRPQGWGDRESWSADEATEPGFECWAERWIQDVGIEDAIHGLDDELARVPVKISYSEGVEITPVSEQFEQDDREALAEVLHERFAPPWTDHWADLDDGQRRGTEAWNMADAIIAAGFRRSPAPQQVSTVEELAALPITSVVLDVFAAVCVRASDSAGALDWRRVTPAVRGGEHRHFPYLPATVLYRPEGGEQ